MTMLSFIGPLLISLLPLALHVIDKALDRLSVFGKERIRQIIAVDGRSRVKAVGENKEVFRAIDNYFEYMDDSRLVVSMSLFNIISLCFAQVECTGHIYVSTYPVIVGLACISIFLLTFLVKALRGGFEPAAVLSVRRWRRVASAFFLLVVAIEVSMKLLPIHLGCNYELPLHERALAGDAEQHTLISFRSNDTIDGDGQTRTVRASETQS